MEHNPALIRVFAVRHGNTFTAEDTPVWVGKSTDLALTEEGRRQAERLGSFLKHKAVVPKAVYSGELKRQREAADIIAALAGGERVISPAFDEIEYGPWEGRTSEEIQRQWSEEFLRWNTEGVWPENVFGGSMELHMQRLKTWISLIQAVYPPGATIVVVSSNGVLRLFQRLDSAAWQRLAKASKIMELKVKTGNYCELYIDSEQAQAAVKNIACWNMKP